MTAIIPFTFENHNIRVIEREGEPWFIAKDVAEFLGYADTDDAIRRHCKALKLLKSGEIPGLNVPPRGMIIIPERDVYRLVMRSKLPSAERFEEWVVGEVLPTIRKTGSYAVQAKRMTVKEALWAALEAEERYEAAEAARLEAVAKVKSVQRQNRDLAEHSYELQKQNSLIVETAESLIAILGPKNNMSLRDAANRLQQPQHKFNDLLHEKGWIYRQPTNPGEPLGRWRPYACHIINGNLVDREFIQDRNTGRITALTPDFGFVDPELYRTFKAVGVTNEGMRKIIQMDDLPNPDAPALQRERRNL